MRYNKRQRIHLTIEADFILQKIVSPKKLRIYNTKAKQREYCY